MPGGVSGDGLEACTLDTCPIEQFGLLHYLPSVPGNVLYLAIFAGFLAPQLIFGLRYKTWGYLTGMIGGLILEVLGYMSRVLLRKNIFNLSFFIMNICCLTLGPAWFSAAIYICLSRIIHIYGEGFSPLRPQTITFVFVTCDVVSMSLQAVGGALTSSAETKLLADQGVDIMIAGLASQVATTVGFVVICMKLYLSIRKNPTRIDPDTLSLRKRRSFRMFLVAIATATITILIRCCYRLAELSQGYDSEIANDEVSFMVLEGAMMVICVFALTVGHPGPILKEMWQVGQINFSTFRARKPNGEKATVAPTAPIRQGFGENDSDSSGAGFESEKTMIGKAQEINPRHEKVEI